MGDAQLPTESDSLASYKVISYGGDIYPLPERYRNLIYSKWMRSYRHGNDYIKLSDSDSYYSAYRRHIDRVLEFKDTVVRLAVLTDDLDVVLGFSVSRGTILDYVHVHKDMRRMGIGKKLIPPGIAWVTHLTKTGLTIWGSKYSDWKFNPFA